MHERRLIVEQIDKLFSVKKNQAKSVEGKRNGNVGSRSESGWQEIAKESESDLEGEEDKDEAEEQVDPSGRRPPPPPPPLPPVWLAFSCTCPFTKVTITDSRKDAFRFNSKNKSVPTR
jgi:hypothetical protein